MLVGARVCAERPKAFERRVHRYGRAGRAEERSVQAHKPASLAKATRAAVALQFCSSTWMTSRRSTTASATGWVTSS